MDAFYASIEQRDNPSLKNKPVIVGGTPQGRGVVAACSYEARRFGVRSAMPCAKASRLCPEAIFVRPRMDKYREVSRNIMDIFTQYTDVIEPLSLDEAFLDTTVNKMKNPSATILAKEICAQIHKDIGLTASAGVSCNKFLAKVASDVNKPNGITIIPPEQAISFLDTLPIRKFFGIGKVTEKKMLQLGIRNGRHLRQFSKEDLLFHFGKSGAFFYDIVRGIDNRPVTTNRKRKSIGSETTFQEDVIEMETIYEVLKTLSNKVAASLNKKEMYALTTTLKVRYYDFTTITRSNTTHTPLRSASQIMSQITRLLKNTLAGRKSVRLLGVSVSKIGKADKSQPIQLPLPFPIP